MQSIEDWGYRGVAATPLGLFPGGPGSVFKGGVIKPILSLFFPIKWGIRIPLFKKKGNSFSYAFLKGIQGGVIKRGRHINLALLSLGPPFFRPPRGGGV